MGQGSSVVTAVALVTAAVPIWSLAWEFPNATGAAIKIKMTCKRKLWYLFIYFQQHKQLHFKLNFVCIFKLYKHTYIFPSFGIFVNLGNLTYWEYCTFKAISRLHSPFVIVIVEASTGQSFFHLLCDIYRWLYSYPPFFFFLGLPLQHMEVPKLGVDSELHPLAYTTATATPDLSCLCKLCHCLWQHQILNPLSEAASSGI